LIGGERKVCLLGIHIRDQWLKNNALQNDYMAALFVSFGVIPLSREGKFVHDIIGTPNLF
jgi:hypothetical protein